MTTPRAPAGPNKSLADLLLRCNWAKRVLFLSDRVALVKQAVNAFKRHLPDAAPVLGLGIALAGVGPGPQLAQNLADLRPRVGEFLH